MATFLDATLLGEFSIVFTFLLVWVIGFGALEVATPFGKKKTSLNALASFAIAMLVVFTAPARVFVEFIVPWFAIIAVLFFFIFLTAMVLGMKMDWVKEQVKGGPVMGWVVGLGVIVALFGLGAAFDSGAHQAPPNTYQETGNGTVTGLQGGEYTGQQYEQQPQEPQRSKFADKLIYTFTHPKMLGVLFLLVLAALSIGSLTAPVTKN